MRTTISTCLPSIALCVGVLVAPADAGFERHGWVAEIAGTAHDVAGTVTIVDETTLLVEHFDYDGGAPAVYFYLGVEDSSAAFLSGLEVPPLLAGVFEDATLTLTLPGAETMDGWNAVSVWCAAFDVSFGSASFAPPPCASDLDDSGDVGFGDLLTLLAAWGPCTPGCVADLDDSGDVGFGDLLTLLASWGVCA